MPLDRFVNIQFLPYVKDPHVFSAFCGEYAT
jgi:hypothetical protein